MKKPALIITLLFVSSTSFADPGIVNAGAMLPLPGWQFPYAPDPFTLAVCASDPCAPVIDPQSSAEVSSLMDTASGIAGGLDLGDIFQGDHVDNDQPVYYASSSDPVYTVTCGGGCGTGSITLNIPNNASASTGSDHHLIVINAATGVENDFWEFNDNGTGTGTAQPVSGGGALHAGSGGECHINAFANNANACANSATGSGLPLHPQMLDPREILSGSINHTLYVAVGCGQNSYVYPAMHSDGVCGASGPKYGQRIWLDLPDTQIDALNDPVWAKTMLHTMHHYGWMVSDNNGGGVKIGFAILAPQTFTSRGQANPWETFWKIAGASYFIAIPTTGISPSHIHILAPCVNTQSC